MGGLWVDTTLMSNVPAVRVGAKPTFSGPRREPARRTRSCKGGRRLFRASRTRSSTTSPDLLGKPAVPTDAPEFKASLGNVGIRRSQWLSINAPILDSLHRELVKIMWNTSVWPATSRARKRPDVRDLGWHSEFPKPCGVGLGRDAEPSLEKARRVDDFFPTRLPPDRDALSSKSPAAVNFREEQPDRRGEAQRDDDSFATSARGNGLAKKPPNSGIAKIWYSKTCKLAHRSYNETPPTMSKHLTITLKVWRQEAIATRALRTTRWHQRDASFLRCSMSSTKN